MMLYFNEYIQQWWFYHENALKWIILATSKPGPVMYVPPVFIFGITIFQKVVYSIESVWCLVSIYLWLFLVFLKVYSAVPFRHI